VTGRQLFHWPVAGRRIDWEILWEPRDLWIGVFWDKRLECRASGDYEWFGHVYVCLIPCLPWHLWWFKGCNHEA